VCIVIFIASLYGGGNSSSYGGGWSSDFAEEVLLSVAVNS
jgi:hypothetical protein